MRRRLLCLFTRPLARPAQSLIRLILLALLILMPVAGAAPASGLETFTDVRLVPTDWADGDSFRVRFADGAEHTVRLYGADCIEWHVSDDADAKRLREQRRHFGIFEYGGSPVTSIALAKAQGEAAAIEVRQLLAKPFTVHTAFANARGDGRYQRIYAFVTTSAGEDLAEALVSRGLARGFGVYRSTPTGLGRDDYRDQLRDVELVAARNGRGAWAYTDWDALRGERERERSERQDTRIATGKALPTQTMDLNTAARDELMRIPGVGEVTANAIIEARPFTSVDDLLRVRGIGAKRLENIRPWVKVGGGA